MAKRSTFTPEGARHIVRSIQRLDASQSIPPLSRANFGGGEGWRTLVGKTDASVVKGFTVTVSLWDGDFGSESDTGTNITAKSYFSDIDSAKWVAVVETVRGYIIIAWEC